MKKIAKTTGSHGIGQMIHVIHMSDDVEKLNRFYEDVFGGLHFLGVDEPNYLPIEDRYAGLFMVGDVCVETMAPAMPADVNKPVGKFYSKFGEHLHSVGYKVDDLPGLAERLLAKGVYIGAPGGGKIEKLDPETLYFYPSPRDTAGLMVEMCQIDMPDDPRDLETWSSQVKMWRSHPLTIERFLYVTLGVRDLESAVSTYVDVMEAVPVQEGVDHALGARFQTLQLGDCLLQLAQPLKDDSDLGRHVAKWGNMIYSLRFKVTDLDSVQSWLKRKNVRTDRLRDDLVVTDIEDSYGAPIFFTTEEIPGDPFAS
jgi:catechol 2,3-dioxygenase-like lactoylglutathione lyase family enzyme